MIITVWSFVCVEGEVLPAVCVCKTGRTECVPGGGVSV